MVNCPEAGPRTRGQQLGLAQQGSTADLAKDRTEDGATNEGRQMDMKRPLSVLAAAGCLLVALPAEVALAQKSGGVLKMYDPDSPASMSIHEEGTIVSERPMMGVFNNLVMFDQHVKQNSLNSIVLDLATGWLWNEDGTELTFPLRQGVTWHDGKPFTAKDVQCTWDMLTDKSSEKLRINPRKAWYRNLEGSLPTAITRSPSISSGPS